MPILLTKWVYPLFNLTGYRGTFYLAYSIFAKLEICIGIKKPALLDLYTAKVLTLRTTGGSHENVLNLYNDRFKFCYFVVKRAFIKLINRSKFLYIYQGTWLSQEPS